MIQYGDHWWNWRKPEGNRLLSATSKEPEFDGHFNFVKITGANSQDLTSLDDGEIAAALLKLLVPWCCLCVLIAALNKSERGLKIIAFMSLERSHNRKDNKDSH